MADSGWGDRVWEFQGSKDQKVTDEMNRRLQDAQMAFQQEGCNLADVFKIPCDTSVNDQVHFYDSSGNITAELLRKKRGGSFAFTKPHSRAIMLPGRDMYKQDPNEMRNLLLHELMHSMGLPEERGQSDDITRTIADYMKKRK